MGCRIGWDKIIIGLKQEKNDRRKEKEKEKGEKKLVGN
jgi:hypothetical protein